MDSIGYKTNIEKATVDNRMYRRILYTTEQTQLVVMSIPPGDDIDKEKHEITTQFIRVEQGNGVAYISDKMYRLKDGDCLIIPSNTWHYIKNTGEDDLKLYTLYSPPEHPKNLVQATHFA